VFNIHVLSDSLATSLRCIYLLVTYFITVIFNCVCQEDMLILCFAIQTIDPWLKEIRVWFNIKRHVLYCIVLCVQVFVCYSQHLDPEGGVYLIYVYSMIRRHFEYHFLHWCRPTFIQRSIIVMNVETVIDRYAVVQPDQRYLKSSKIAALTTRPKAPNKLKHRQLLL